MNYKEYTVSVDGEQIKVSEYEIKRFFEELSDSEVTNETWAGLIAQRKVFSKKCVINADLPFYAGLALGGDLGTGECLYFKFGYDTVWNVSVKRTNEGRYALYASNLQNITEKFQIFDTKREAILFCANRFNENVSVKNQYPDIQTLLKEYEKQFNRKAKEEVLANMIERGVNDCGFNYKEFAQNIRTMHPTLQQNFFRLIKESVLFMADKNSHFIDPRNQGSHEICTRLVEVLQDCHIPYI